MIGTLRRMVLFRKRLRTDIMLYYLLPVVQRNLLAARWSNFLPIVRQNLLFNIELCLIFPSNFRSVIQNVTRLNFRRARHWNTTCNHDGIQACARVKGEGRKREMLSVPSFTSGSYAVLQSG